MRGPLNLRAQLLLLVGGPLLLLLLIETFVSYEIGLHTANQVFDRWLLDSAYSMSQEVSFEEGEGRFLADEKAVEAFGWDELDSVYFRIGGLDGQLIEGTSAIPDKSSLAGLDHGPVFESGSVAGESVRMVSVLVRDGSQQAAVVTVAETINKRSAMTGELMTEVLISKTLLFLAVMSIIGVAFSRGLKPLVVLNRELAQRSSRDLTPITVERAPVEVWSLVDNTNQLLARLDSAMTSREQFIGNIAHQIRTPLAGIKLQAQLARRESDPDTIHPALDRISVATDQMSHVNSQLMKLARAEAASGRGLRSERLDLVDICCQVVNELNARARGRGVQLEMRLPDRPVEVMGELTLLQEMVWNLLENAIIYGRQGGHVWTQIDETAEGVTLAIEDDGPGISREHWPRIFERFFRPTAATVDGCGLGLAIVREIALAHGASVELDEPRNGLGIRFVVRFNHPPV